MEGILGIDITLNAIRIVDLTYAENGLKINSSGSVLAPVDTLQQGVVVKPKILAASIRQYLKDKAIETKRAAMCIHSPHTLTRLIRLPSMKKEEYRFAIEKEISQYMVFQNREVIMDSSMIEEIIDERGIKRANVVFTVAPKAILNSYCQLADASGLDLVNIDVNPIAAMRALSLTNLKASFEETVMLLIVDEESIDISVLKANRLRFSHTAKIASKEFLEKPDEFIEKVTSALRLALNFYQTKFSGGEEVAKLVVGTAMPQHTEIIKQRFSEIPVEAAEVAEGGALAAIGAALYNAREVEFPLKLNLLASDYIQKKILIKQMRYAGILFVAIVVLFSIVNVIQYVRRVAISRKINKIHAQLSNPPAELAQIIATRDEQRLLEEGSLKYSSLINRIDITPWHYIIAEAMAKAPEGLRIRGISSGREDELTITGEASSEDPVYNYVKLLNSSLYFSGAEINSLENAKQKETGLFQFSITCKIKRI